jgi:N6-adenosine-specific RNA methylase IME4
LTFAPSATTRIDPVVRVFSAGPMLPIADIAVGERHRREMGDIEALARSIDAVGLLHPIVVRPDGKLIAGERRLMACKSLGWETIPVTAVDIDKIARGEAAENFDRKDFTWTEAVSIGRELAPAIEAAAKDRQGRPGAERSGKLPEHEKGQARDKVAKAVGKRARSLVKAEAIVAAAEAEPEKFAKLVEDMDRTGRVDGPFKRLKVARQAAAIRAEPPPYPNRGPYRVIVLDPPWPYENRKEDPSHRATHPYPQMSIAQICAERDKILAIAHPDLIVWLWTTNHHMRESFAVLDALGVVPKTMLTWVKDKMGTGDWLRGQTEHCHMAVRGKPTVHLTNQTTLLHGPLRENSRKPDEFFPFVEGLCPAPRYAYLFARTERESWDCHGDETGLFGKAAVA